MNLIVLAAQALGWAGCLTLASRSSDPWALAALMVFFCLMMQGVFSMMHECFHGHGHRSVRINYLMMWLSSTMFGASATFIHINHLGHHRRNRSPAERADYFDAQESRLRKTVAYYAAILGGLWLGSALGSVLLALAPPAWTRWLARAGERNTYAAAFAEFRAADFLRIRLEVAAAIGFWVLIGLALGWRPAALLLMYGAFAFSWSSLQWVYHMRTPLDLIEGAYNLRLPAPIRWLFLNFNYNLTHHRAPQLRWQSLYGASDADETRPLWFSYLTVFLPPEPLPDPAALRKTYF